MKNNGKANGMAVDPPWVPPLKCQGIKTKLVSEILRIVSGQDYSKWVEPFCGSCVVPLNVRPKKALLADTNVHIVQFYKDIQRSVITPDSAKEFLVAEGERLKTVGGDYYYLVRDRFNNQPNSLDFLFLNRSCFNGVMRFNRNGKFNVPYCHKNTRFAKMYVTKIVNQVRRVSEAIKSCEWEFVASDYRQTLASLRPSDIVYADPPYAGRHADYFNSWSDADEFELAETLKSLPCKFILSTWQSNKFRTNPVIRRTWNDPRFHVIECAHFYHVGPSENLRHPMIEALIANFPVAE